MMRLFSHERFLDQRVFTSSDPAAKTRELVTKGFHSMGFMLDEQGPTLVARRGSREEWWRDGLHHVPQKLELLPVQVEAEIGDAPCGSVVRITLIDSWEGGIRAGAEDVYRPCFWAVMEELSRAANLIETFRGSTLQTRVLSTRFQSSARTRAYATLALSVVFLTLVVLFLQDTVSLILASLFR